jgi:hypothetical protein
MHGITAKLKNGTVICGTMWTWRPISGWLSLVDDETGQVVTVQLADAESVVTHGGRRTAATAGEDVDDLERARKEGWAG